MVKKKSKKVSKRKVSKKKICNCCRGPSEKPKNSKVQKLIKLAKKRQAEKPKRKFWIFGR